MPTKSNGRGSFLIEKSYRGVGSIRRASGTQERRTFRRVVAMLDHLYQLGRLDLLDEVRQGNLTPLELYATYRVGAFDRLPTAEGVRSLRRAAAEFAESHDCSERHRRDIRYYLAGFPASDPDAGSVPKDGVLLRGERDDVAVSELPRILKKYRDECSKKGTATAFRMARTVSLAFIHRTLSRHHKLWYQTAEVELLSERREPTHPFTVLEARAIESKLGPDLGPAFMTMCTTGMGPGEYWGDWEAGADRVMIHGTKREARERVVPLVREPVRPPLSYGRFSKSFREAMAELDLDGVLYDCRRAYATWMANAKIPRARRKAYLGHQSGDVTDRYEEEPVERHLSADARALGDYLDTESRTDTASETPRMVSR